MHQADEVALRGNEPGYGEFLVVAFHPSWRQSLCSPQADRPFWVAPQTVDVLVECDHGEGRLFPGQLDYIGDSALHWPGVAVIPLFAGVLYVPVDRVP